MSVVRRRRRRRRRLSAAITLAIACLAGAAAGRTSRADTTADPDEIVVTASLRGAATVRETPASIAVLDAATVQTAAVQHFEEIAALVANLNWSGEGSRARYFQVRGTGELEQYEGAPNASVGFIVDDIDFSGLGGIATTFDTERVEVLRGPQGTRYGANALGGLIYVQTAAPPETALLRVEALGGSDGAQARAWWPAVRCPDPAAISAIDSPSSNSGATAFVTTPSSAATIPTSATS
jgi:outer membrane receptor for ferrienterochelin and colicin